jgi:hypothetical protein
VNTLRLIHIPVRLACLSLLACLAFAPSCSQDIPDLVKVTGKTVYQDMAIEEIRIRALRWNEGRWKEYAAARSGYHGSFVLRVPPGRYRLEAKGEIFHGRRKVVLEGYSELPDIRPGMRSVNRVLMELAPVPQGT